MADSMSGSPSGPAFSMGLPAGMDASDDTPVFVISVAAQLSGMHPQTLRQYDRLGLVSPGRATGRGRRYSARNVAQLLAVQRLSQEEGVNLAGIKRVLELEDHVTALQHRLAEMEHELAVARSAITQAESRVHAAYRRDLVPLPQRDVLVWQPTDPRATPQS
jgi:MerR family transcriptional regulator/heat shock protein HspR